MKSESGSKPRLKRTIRGKTSFRPIEDEDVKYIGAAWKKGALKRIPHFDGIKAEDFRGAFERYVLADFPSFYVPAVWTIKGETEKGDIPIGIVFGLVVGGKVLLIHDIAWFPWTPRRLLLEAAVNFVNEMRESLVVLEFADLGDKAFFEHMSKYGIMRRVGTIHDLAVSGEPIALFQSRKRQWRQAQSEQ